MNKFQTLNSIKIRKLDHRILLRAVDDYNKSIKSWLG